MTSPVADTLDTRPLVEPLTPADVEAELEVLRRSEGPRGVSRFAGHVTAILLVGFLAVVFVGVGLGIPYLLSQDSLDPLPAAAVLVPLAVTAAGVVAALIAARLIRRRDRLRAARMSRFARANGMAYRAHVPGPRPGMIFRAHSDGEAVTRDGERSWEVGGVTTRVPFGRSTRRGPRWGYTAVQLDRPLPHIMLDARGNNSLLGRTRLPDTALRSQRLSLEGDFDRWFTLYCPAGYERAALYLFTPDIMAMMIDRFAELDVEIIDDWVFFYSRNELVSFDPAVWEWLVAVTAAVERKLGQWERWTDDDAPPLPSSHPAVDAIPGASRPPHLRRRVRLAPILYVSGLCLLGVVLIVDLVVQLLGR
ncbi:hypothetical protein [Microbacterium sp. CFBP9034]|uniref:hypothetical protein n=1 Tax=Microbacterium sp. CFBP9034 TaxID=3096540 RepID=UPI002A69C16F|nr:hypothetical protein [Microbacterium sp. CFBP9034]MDY0908114.1 hypothetical protein [Microbacterium sp. CFBP9034]